MSEEIPKVNNKLPRPFNILTLDGCGTRGVIEAVLIERLQKDFPSFIRDTDLLVGTSIGGIQALALAAGKDPSFLRSLFEKSVQKVFEDALLHGFRDAWKMSKANYSNANLRRVLEDVFGEMSLGDLDKRVAITTFDLDNELGDVARRSWKVKVFHNCQGPDADLDEKVVDVALRTSAAPTFFPTVDGFVDGGLVATNPAMIGLTQALDPRGPNKELKDISLLSIGAGKANHYIKGTTLDWGMTRWSPFLLYLMFEGSIEMVHVQCKRILRKKYHRLDTIMSERVGLDDWKQIPKFIELANQVEIAETRYWLQEHWL